MSERDETTDEASTVLRARATCPEWSDLAAPIPRRREGKVLYVIALMAAARWVTGESGPRLAASWGISQAYIEQIAAEASRRSKENAPVVRARLAVLCEKGVGLVEDELDLAAAGAGKCEACGRSDLDAVRAIPPLVDKYDGLFREKGVTINNTVIQSLTVDQIRAAPAVQEMLGALADSWRGVASELRRLSQGGGDLASVLAAARAHERVMLGRGDDVDVVEALPAGGEESENE